MKTFFIVYTFFIAGAAYGSSSMQIDDCQYPVKRYAENGHTYRPAPAFRESAALLKRLNAELLNLISHPDSNKRDMFIAVCLSAADQYQQHAGDGTPDAFVYARLKMMAGIAQKRTVAQ